MRTSPFVLFHCVWQLRRRIRWLVLLVISYLIVLPGTMQAGVLINELMWAGSDLSASDEWVELALDPSDVPCDLPLSLSGVTLTVVNTSGVEVPVIKFGADLTIACEEYLVVSRFDADHSRLSDFSSFTVSSLSLPNTKLLVRLRDSIGNVLDSADDGIGEPMAGKNSTLSEPIRVSMERVNFSLDGGLKESWTSAVQAVGFDDGSSLRGTPGFANGVITFSSSSRAESAPNHGDTSNAPSSDESSVSSQELSQSSSLSLSDQIIYSSNSSKPFMESESHVTSSSFSTIEVSSSPSVYISEILPNPVGQDTGEWIEIANTGLRDIDISGWTIASSGSSIRFQIPSETTLAPGQYRAFQKSQTGLSFGNRGGLAVLMRGSETMDYLVYGDVPEGISVGRLSAASSPQPFCIPTEGLDNDELLPDVAIHLQSGNLEGQESVSVNLTAVSTPQSIQSSAECFWDFQDGFTSGSCNPPSHTFDTPGAYSIRLEMKDYCINTLVRSIDVHVYEKERSSSNFSSLSASSPAASMLPVPMVSSLSYVVVSGVLPNPIGQDQGAEWIEIQNTGSNAVVLDGWMLQSTVASRSCTLERIQLKPAEHRKLTLLECPIGLSNEAGGIRLIDPGSAIRSVVEWHEAMEGKIYKPVDFILSDGMMVSVLRVIDGDTIEASVGSGGKIIRLVGIDAPELARPGRSADPYAEKSRNLLRALIEDKKVELKFDSKKEDIYGRILAYAFISGTDIQKQLLKNGLVRVYLKSDFLKKEEYLSEERKAREAWEGIWSPSIEGRLRSVSSRAEVGDEAVVPLSIYISEIYPFPNKGEGEWIKLFNPNNQWVNLAGWRLDDIENGGSRPWVIPEGWGIGAGEELVIMGADSGLKMNDDGDEVHLRSPEGSFYDSMSFKHARKGQKISKNDQKMYSQSTSLKRAPSQSISTKNAKSIGIARRYKTPILFSASGEVMSHAVPASLAGLQAQVIEKMSYQHRPFLSLNTFIGTFSIICLMHIVWFFGGRVGRFFV